jgi:hypothetical protein
MHTPKRSNKNEMGYTPTKRFPSIFSSGAEPTFLGTRLTSSPTDERPDSHRYHTVASRGTHLCAPGIVGKGSLAASIGYWAYRSHSRQVFSTFQSLAHESHWTGAQIPCSYHMRNPFIKIL